MARPGNFYLTYKEQEQLLRTLKWVKVATVSNSFPIELDSIIEKIGTYISYLNEETYDPVAPDITKEVLDELVSAYGEENSD